MNGQQFYDSRHDRWDSLAALVERGSRDPSRLSPDDVRELARLYRTATADLALAQRDYPGQRMTIRLNQLVAASHGLLYRKEPLSLRRTTSFVRVGYPRLFRRSWRFLVASTLLFFLPALLAGLLIRVQPSTVDRVLPFGAQSLVDDLENHELWIDIPMDERPYASSFIMTNNIRVTFLAFAGGITAGLLTVWVLLTNGLLLGGVFALTANYGLAFDLATFVIGHGVIELTAIVISGASGLMMGWAILRPGFLRRRDALAQSGRDAVLLVLGCIPMLIVAGVIEGFISPNDSLAWPVKWTVGILSGLCLFAYLLLAGRSPNVGRSGKSAGHAKPS